MPPGQTQPVASSTSAEPEIELATIAAPPEAPIRAPTGESSFFHGADSATINGGNFVGIARLENNQIYYNYMTMLPPGLAAGPAPDHRDLSQATAEQDRHRGTNASVGQRRLSFPRAARVVRAVVRMVRGRIPEQRIPQPSTVNLVERDIFQTYKRHMLPKGYGHPLWIPQCNIQLPVEYRKIGVRIGDVGIITHEGAFDCLFNICLTREDPINSLVPDGFLPLNPPLDERHHIIRLRDFSSNAYIASDGIHVEHLHPNGIDFVTAEHDGAILTMPKGAYIQRLANKNHFDDYIAKHASSWYKLANGPLKRGIKNGDLRIVLGCHKSTAWGMATFARPVQPTTEAPRLRFTVDPHNANTRPFFWQKLNGAGPVMTKVGPEPGDNDDLFENQPEEFLNQCLFMQARVVSLSEDAWASVYLETAVSAEDGAEASAPFQSKDTQRRRSGGTANIIPNGRTLENRGRQSAVILGDIPQPLPAAVEHSKVVNDFLLEQDERIDVAVTDENDWIAFLEKDAIGRVDPFDLVKRMQGKINLHKTPSGLVHIEMKQSKTLSAQSVRTRAANLMMVLRQGQATVQETLLGHLSRALDRLAPVLHPAYALNLNSGSKAQSLPPFLMEASEDLFAFENILQSSRKENDLLAFTKDHSPNDLSLASQLWLSIDASPSNPCRGKYFKALGDISWKRYLTVRSPIDLDETIWLYEKAISLTLPFSVESLIPIFGICSALYRRFYLRRGLQDLVRLARYRRHLNRVDFQDLVTQLIMQSTTSVRNPGAYGYQELSLRLREPDPEERNGIPTGSGNTPRKESHITVGMAPLYGDIFDIFSHAEGAESHALTRVHSRMSSQEQDAKFDELFKLTKNWLEQHSPAFSILWLYGPSAMGLVSRITRQLPVSDSKSDIAASFTFSDKAAWNNEINELFHSIAFDLASSIPGLLEEYRRTMTKEDSRKLVDAPLRSQFWKFVVKPVLKISATAPTHVPTVIINGIDRCGYQKARIVLTIIAEALEIFNLPLRFIISSNRDTRIQDAFNLPRLSKMSRQFFVGVQPSEYLLRAGNSDPTDILVRGLPTLLKRHSHSSMSRGKHSTNSEVMDALVERSRGNGVYANTVVNFLNATGETSKAFNDKLRLVLEPTLPTSREQALTASFTELDTLFSRILSTHPDPDTLVHALGILLVIHDCAQPQTILRNLFGMSTNSLNSVFEVLESLMQFPKLENERNTHPWRAVKKKLPNKDQRTNSPFLVLALLSLSTTIPTAFTIPLAFRDRVHDSFYDFLVNPERSGRFHIDIPYFHGLMTLAGFRCVVHCMWRPSRHDLRRSANLSADTWDYLKFHLQDHYAQCSSGVREQLLDEMQHTLQTIASTYADKSEPSSETKANIDELFDKVAILINMLIDDWDAFGEWSHSADKHRYKDFRQAMNSMSDELFPRRHIPRLSKLSGKLRLDGHHGHRDRPDSSASLFSVPGL